MNNKGFAITGIIYGLMLLFIVIVTSFLSILIGRNKRIDALLEGAYSSVEYDLIEIDYNDTDKYFYNGETKFLIEGQEEQTDIYITPQKGLYKFKIGEKSIFAYFPDDVMIITNNVKKDANGSTTDLYYYKLKNENEFTDDLSEFKKIDNIYE